MSDAMENSKAKLKRHRDNWKRRAEAAENRVAELEHDLEFLIECIMDEYECECTVGFDGPSDACVYCISKQIKAAALRGEGENDAQT